MSRFKILDHLFHDTPHVVKNLIIINVLMFIATLGFERFMITNFALYYPASPLFHPYQLVTHMFMHGSFPHLFFNMYALWMFGRILEKVWGSKRFLFYYMATGFGAVALHLLVDWGTMFYFSYYTNPELLDSFITNFGVEDALELRDQNFVYTYASEWSSIMTKASLGASGAVYGVLLAFGYMFPLVRLRLLFPPIELTARLLVIILGSIEFLLGLLSTEDGIAHFAHLGGIFSGVLIVVYWKHKNKLHGDY